MHTRVLRSVLVGIAVASIALVVAGLYMPISPDVALVMGAGVFGLFLSVLTLVNLKED